MGVYFVTGIDTDIGKTYVTGLLGRFVKKNLTSSVITQKIAQTGCIESSEDIKIHREIMEMELTEFDKNGTTCPYVFPFPASPHLSSELEDTEIDPEKISGCTEILRQNYDEVIVEGVGGLLVPIKRDFTVADYIVTNDLPVILVTSSKLGNLNHTFLNFEFIKLRDIRLKNIIYLRRPDENKKIAEDSKLMICNYLKKLELSADLTEIFEFNTEFPPDQVNLSTIFN